MKKIFALLFCLMLSLGLFASTTLVTVGGDVGWFINFGNAGGITLNSGITPSIFVDTTFRNDTIHSFGIKTKLTSDLDPFKAAPFYSAVLMVEPKYTISFNDSTRLSIAGVLDVGYAHKDREKKGEQVIVDAFFAGFGADLFLDVDITENFGMGGGLVSTADYGFKDNVKILTTRIYLSAYYII